MRVITGIAKGRRLRAPEGDSTRPTSDIAKEGIFSAIQFEVQEAFVLDLFAGSGQMGLEALSRGARFAVFVDNSRDAQQIIRENLQSTELFAKSRVVAMDYLSFLSGSSDLFDIVFIDPPYGQGMAAKAALAVSGKMRDDGIIICETDKKELMPEAAGNFDHRKQYRYGKTLVTIYRKKGE